MCKSIFANKKYNIKRRFRPSISFIPRDHQPVYSQVDLQFRPFHWRNKMGMIDTATIMPVAIPALWR